MQAEYLSYKDTNSFSRLMVNYLDGDKLLNGFIKYDNSLEGFKKIISERNNISVDRNILVERLNIQNSELKLSKISQQNIEQLVNKDTFTITTGHQLNYFTGPLYYIYKTASIIKLCRELSAEFPNKNFVPIFWMATEDHDFEEISKFSFNHKEFEMSTIKKGAVGRISMEEIEFDKEVLFSVLGVGDGVDYLKILFEKAYLNTKTLADATRFLVNELFGEYGIVIIDGDDIELKKPMIPFFKKELIESASYKNLNQTNTNIKNLGYKVQVNQRDINLFYLKDNLRERIILVDEEYKILNSDISFSKEEIIDELEKHPERFSPNAILRPLYQEHILPNIAYVGGGGELAYWFQLKQNFNDFGVSFPILVLRNSLLLIKENQQKEIEKLGLTVEDLFLDIQSLIKKKVIENATSNLDVSELIAEADKLLEKELSANVENKGIIPSLRAKHKKRLNEIKKIEKKLLRNEKKIQHAMVEELVSLKSNLFPSNSLQERKLNFSEMYLEFGDELIPEILRTISMLNNSFTVLKH